MIQDTHYGAVPLVHAYARPPSRGRQLTTRSQGRGGGTHQVSATVFSVLGGVACHTTSARRGSRWFRRSASRPTIDAADRTTPASWACSRSCVNPVTELPENTVFPQVRQISGRDGACPHGTDAQCGTATCSQRHVRVWPLFVGVSLAGGGVSVGHNRTRPPPCMRWRGPCSTYRSRLAGLPGSAGSGGPTAGASHPLLVPVSRLLPRPRSFPWGGARFRRESISTPQSSAGASVRGEQLRFFSLSTE